MNAISDDVDMIGTSDLEISASEPNITDNMGMISTIGLEISASKANISDDVDMISTNDLRDQRFGAQYH